MDRHRIMELWTSAGKVGTGYLVADRLVLTAYHVAAEGTVDVRPLGSATWTTAKLAWPEQEPDLVAHPEADAALLRITDPSWQPPAGREAVLWGRVAGHDRVPCVAVGFPDAQERNRTRDTKEIRGHVETLTGLKSGLVTVNVDQSAVPSSFRGGSGWAGASGAALFCDRRLVGVLTTDRSGAYPADQLVAVPVATLVARPGFRMVAMDADVRLEDVSAVGTFGGTAALRSPGDVDGHGGINNLPDVPSRVFVGRHAAFAALDAALTEGTTAITQTLSGLGGVGKSTLALHYARSRLHQYHLVWWIRADTPAQITGGLAALTARVHGTVPDLTTDALAEWAIGWLQSHPGWLIVLDNAESPVDIRTLSGQLSHAGRLLITTRYREGWPAAPIELHPLDARSSLAVLTGWTGRTADVSDADAMDLVSELGNLPLALEQAGAYIAQTRISAADYLAQLRRRPDTMIDTPPEGGDHQRTVGRIWSLTMATIGDRNPLAAQILHVVAWFAPDGVPRDLLSPLGAGDTDVPRALALLAAYSMVTLDAETVSVHRLVQAVARSASAGDAESIARHRLRAAELLEQALPDGDPNVPHFAAETWPRWRALLPHIHAHVALTEPAQDTTTTANVLAMTACFLMCQAQNRQAVSYHERAFDARERLLGPDHPDTLMSRNGLGHACQSVDEARAAALHERNLLDRTRVLGADHPDTLRSANNLANTYVLLDRVEEGVELHQRTLSARERVLGPRDPYTLWSVHNLGYAYWMSGDLSRAAEWLSRATSDREEVLGPDSYDTISSRSDLARVYQQAGDLDQSIVVYRRALADSERVLGPDHPDTLTLRRDLGCAHVAVGSPETAVQLLRTALTEHERVLGGDHINTLSTRNDLAAAYRAAGDPDTAMALLDQNLVETQRAFETDDGETLAARTALAFAYSNARPADGLAFELLEHVLATYESVAGPDSPHTARARHNLAVAYESAGAAERAAPLFESNVDTYERTMGADHPLTVNTRARLASALSTFDPRRAVGVYEIVLRVRERMLGPDHPDTFNIRDELAYAHVRAGDFPAGSAILQRLLDDRRRVLGDSDDLVLVAAGNLGLAYVEAEEFAKAIELLSRTLADSERIVGPEHVTSLAARHNLGLAHKDSGNLTAAIELLTRNLPACERVLGQDHPNTVTGREMLAHAYQLAGRPREAAELYDRIVTYREWAFGPDHPQTINARNSLGVALLDAGEAARAAALFESCLASLENTVGPDDPDTEIARENLALAQDVVRADGRVRTRLRHLVERAIPNRRQRTR
ncbi:tetratricopeptide repeat protein [Actinophytocola sp.]|uniref:tetratricopeptide repeat protein n=1 Tax=Actinophytocola sp. TaxID=1872138 RepID=UPI002ED3DFBD